MFRSTHSFDSVQQGEHLCSQQWRAGEHQDQPFSGPRSNHHLTQVYQGAEKSPAAPTALKTSYRRYDIDWLRVVSVLLVVGFHVTEMFDPTIMFHYVKGEPNALAAAIDFFALQWIIPLLFLVAGLSAWWALDTRTGKQFALDRVKRLLPPLVFGTVVLVPIMSYFQMLQSAVFVGSFLQFYQVYFFSYITQEGWGHLWYLAYLLVFSLAALPVFLALKRPRGRRLADWITRNLGVGGILLLLPVPLVFIEVTLRARYPFGMPTLVSDWASLLSFLTLFIYGYLIVSNPLVQDAVKKVRFVALGAGFATTLGRFALAWTGNLPAPNYSLGWSLYMVLNAFDSWFWLTTILGFGFKHLNVNTKALGHLSEIVLPIYILHLPIAVIIAFYVIAWPTFTIVKALVILGATLVATLGLCELCVRRTRVTRFLFGIRTQR